MSKLKLIVWMISNSLIGVISLYLMIYIALEVSIPSGERLSPIWSIITTVVWFVFINYFFLRNQPKKLWLLALGIVVAAFLIMISILH